MNDHIKPLNKTPEPTFEDLKKTNQRGQDFWSARDLSRVLGYSEFRHFIPVIHKAKEACNNSGQDTANHFEDILEMVKIGLGENDFFDNFNKCCNLFIING